MRPLPGRVGKDQANHTTCERMRGTEVVVEPEFTPDRPLLITDGCHIITEPGPRSENVFLALLGGLRKGPRVRFPLPTISQADVEDFRSMAEAGTSVH